jgi:hypothetical protein
MNLASPRGDRVGRIGSRLIDVWDRKKLKLIGDRAIGTGLSYFNIVGCDGCHRILAMIDILTTALPARVIDLFGGPDFLGFFGM